MSIPAETVIDEHGTEWLVMARFSVSGLPQPGGSKRGFYIEKIKRVVIVDDNKRAKSWKDTVAAFAADHWGSRSPLDGTLAVDVVFTLPRPQSHFRTGKRAGELREDAPQFHTKKPDGTKLFRSTEDSLTGILWRDDSLIADQRVRKIYGDKPGAAITVYSLVGATEPAEETGGLDV